MKHANDEALIFEALSQIETPKYDIAAAVARQRVSKTRPRLQPVRRGVVFAVVGAALALSVGAAAVAGVNGMWGAFFGPIPSNAVSTVGNSQTSGDYTLTVEDAIVDENSVLLLLSLRRTDGADIDPRAHLHTNTLGVQLRTDAGESHTGVSGFEDSQLSEDGKTLYFCYEHRRNEQTYNLLGQTLTFTADGVGIQCSDPDGSLYVRGGTAISLAPLAEQDIPVFDELELMTHGKISTTIREAVEQQDFSLALPLADCFPQSFPPYTLCGLAFTANGPVLALREGTFRSGDLVCTYVHADSLIDTRDGTRYEFSQSLGLDLADGTDVSLNMFRNCPLTVEDLPYLELEVSYSIDQLLSEEPFSLSFTPDSTSAITIPVEDTVTIAGAELHPTEVRLSALGILAYFDDDMEDAGFLYYDGTAPILTLADGTTLTTEWSGGHGSQNGSCAIRFAAKDETGQRIFFDTSQIQSVTFGDWELTIRP